MKIVPSGEHFSHLHGHDSEIEAGEIMASSPRREAMELTLLRAYRDAWYSSVESLTDYQAAMRSQVGGMSPWRRCTSLRAIGLIEQVYNEDGSEATRINPHSNRPAILSRITPDGLRRLA